MQIFQCLQKRLYDINCQTRLIAFITMIISLIISSIIVGAFSNMQQDFIETNTHLGEDLILLLILNYYFLSNRVMN